MSEAIQGFWVALPTPLTAKGAIDHAALVSHGSRLLQEGADGVVPFGTTGEGQSFSAEERLAATAALLSTGIAPDRIGLGAAFPALPGTIHLVRAALDMGLRHMLLLPPYFHRDVAAQGIEDAFAAIIDAVRDDRLRVTLYHIPQTSGLAIPPKVAANLRRRYGQVIAGLKDSSGQFANFLAFREAAPELAITVGHEADIARAVAAGGAGTICGMANIAPHLVRAMFRDATAAGPMAEAIALLAGPFVPTLKAVMAAQTGHAGWLRVRPPLQAAPAAQGAAIAAGLHSLLGWKAA
jgi:4-hydroxy-tetrahydrodipicolinate synthase